MFTPAAVSTPVGLTLKLAMDTARQAILQAMAKPGKQYQVQASSDLKAWTTVANLTAAADGAVAYTDTTSKYFSRRFYRLLEPGAASLPPAGPVLTISLNPKREAMIRANATPGKAYALEASGDMKAWSVLANLTGADDLTVTYTDLTSKYFSRRYYRLRDN
jgi:alpha-D-ribose 1-methylphosphonate 5-triphosphate synthase subunit PhnH